LEKNSVVAKKGGDNPHAKIKDEGKEREVDFQGPMMGKGGGEGE